MKKESKKTVAVFSLASFLNDMGSDMIYPVWPLFVTTVLNANMAALGFLDGLGDAIVSVSQAGSGYLSDKTRKRKVFIWTGYAMGALSRVGYALSTAWQHLIPLKILDRAGKMRGAPRDAIIADVSTKKNRGRNFGILRMMDNLGAVVGILLTIWLVSLISIRDIFLLASIPSAIGVLLILVFIRERKTKKLFKGFSFRDLDKNFRLFLLSSVLFALASFSYSFLLIYAKEAGFEVVFVPVLYLIFTLAASLSSLPFGRLADIVGRKKMMMLSYVLFMAMSAGFLVLRSMEGIVVLFVLYGLHRGALEPVQKTFVSELAPRNFRASALGTFQMAVGLAALPASMIAGFAWVAYSMYAPFLVSLVLAVLGTVVLVGVREK
jgi:MFS family permease